MKAAVICAIIVYVVAITCSEAAVLPRKTTGKPHVPFPFNNN